MILCQSVISMLIQWSGRVIYEYEKQRMALHQVSDLLKKQSGLVSVQQMSPVYVIFLPKTPFHHLEFRFGIFGFSVFELASLLDAVASPECHWEKLSVRQTFRFSPWWTVGFLAICDRWDIWSDEETWPDQKIPKVYFTKVYFSKFFFLQQCNFWMYF